MSEADAEDGLHGLDANHSGMNEGTTAFAFCASGCRKDTEQRASFDEIICCPLWSFLAATQTKNFLSSFRLSAEGWGEEPDKEMQGSFWVCPRESASAVEARSSAIGAYEKISSHHARGACEVSQGFCKSRFWRSTIETPNAVRNDSQMGRGRGEARVCAAPQDPARTFRACSRRKVP
jgi:hypothetical protein